MDGQKQPFLAGVMDVFGNSGTVTNCNSVQTSTFHQTAIG